MLPKILSQKQVPNEANTSLIDVPVLKDGEPYRFAKNALERPKKTFKTAFSFLKSTQNPKYLSGVKPVSGIPFESCLIVLKSDKHSTANNKENTEKTLKNKSLALQCEPKWYTTLQCLEVDAATGEVLGIGVYETNSFKRANASKIKAMDAFSNAYSDLYKKRQVTCFFHTFTDATRSDNHWRNFMDVVLKRYKRLGFPVLGYVWTLEVGETKGMIHYHLVVAIDRFNLRKNGIPKALKFEDTWGARTEIDTVKKNVRHYLAKYFAKNQRRVLDMDTNRTLRSVGKSKAFKLPSMLN